MYNQIITAALFLSVLKIASAESCTFGTYSCQSGSTSRCTYTSGVAAAGGGYPTGWVTLQTCANGCEVVGGVAQCGNGGGTTLETKAATSLSQAAATSTSVSESEGAVFAEVTKTAVASAVKSSSPALASSSSSSASVILSSVAGQPVDATFYYDMNGGGTCGAVNGITSYAENSGYTYCESNNVANAKTLGQRGTNNIVAMPANLITGNAAKYCGKKVVVTWNGVKRTDLDLFIWDACVACSANDGLDFSSTIFGELAGSENCGEGRIENKMSWEIVNESVLTYTP